MVGNGSTRFRHGFAAARRKLRLAILQSQTAGPDGWCEADGETPSAARETRKLPKTNCIVPPERFQLD